MKLDTIGYLFKRIRLLNGSVKMRHFLIALIHIAYTRYGLYDKTNSSVRAKSFKNNFNFPINEQADLVKFSYSFEGG